jgi:hypothetical protein
MSPLISRVPYCFGVFGRRSNNHTNRRSFFFLENKWSMKFLIHPWERKWKERPTVVLVHGFGGYSDSRRSGGLTFGSCCGDLAKAFKKNHDVNVVEVKWKNGFWYGYDGAVKIIGELGQEIASWLNDKLGHDLVAWKNLTIVGASLGGKKRKKTDESVMHLIESIAHIVGWVGRKTNHKVGKIVALDPASELILFQLILR